MKHAKLMDNSIKIGTLVYLKEQAKGYPMLPNPIEELGAGIVIDDSSAEIESASMVQVLWSRTNTQRWEFVDDLIIVQHT